MRCSWCLKPPVEPEQVAYENERFCSTKCRDHYLDKNGLKHQSPRESSPDKCYHCGGSRPENGTPFERLCGDKYFCGLACLAEYQDARDNVKEAPEPTHAELHQKLYEDKSERKTLRGTKSEQLTATQTFTTPPHKTFVFQVQEIDPNIECMSLITQALLSYPDASRRAIVAWLGALVEEVKE